MTRQSDTSLQIGRLVQMAESTKEDVGAIHKKIDEQQYHNAEIRQAVDRLEVGFAQFKKDVEPTIMAALDWMETKKKLRYGFAGIAALGAGIMAASADVVRALANFVKNLVGSA
jgi:hypothetical protein